MSVLINTGISGGADSLNLLQSGPLSNDPSKAPNATSVNNAINAALAASAAPTTTTYATAIVLDKVQGRDYGSHLMIANDVLTVGGGTVQNGWAVVALLGDGSHTPDLTAFTNVNGYVYVNTAGATNIYSIMWQYGTALLWGCRGAASDITAPTLTSQAIRAGDGTIVDLVFSEALTTSPLPVASSFVTAGHTYTSIVADDPSHFHLVTSTAFVAGDTPVLAYTQPGTNNLRDVAGNLLANLTNASITNSLVSYATTVLADTPVIYLKLDETSGTSIADSSGNARTATLSGAVTLAQSGLITGSSKSILFTVAGAAEIKWTGQLLTTSYSGALSFECIFNLTNLSQVNCLMTKDRTSPTSLEGVRMYVLADGTLNFSVVTTTPSTSALDCGTGSGYISAGTTYHVVGTWEPAVGLNLYVNGTLVHTTVDTSHTIIRDGQVANICVGTEGGSPLRLAGTIDEIAVYNTSLSQARVTAHYNARTQGP